MRLHELLAQLPSDLVLPVTQHPALDEIVTGLCANSKECRPGNLFIGMPGTRVDGGEFWPNAIENGAIAAVISPNALKNKPASDSATLLIPIQDIA
ncbi:MAG: UDP-N-acetylmuramoyl-L-alanyl-D-glutamate--2,6-diaminopimelate ligase, partial [Leptolyngbya sp. SIO3F4]|nr:UDP-N-acetylmuramoyl-L-alanyl-D-glutamate--2,6-diaminopimelate ligase [Leptolyngbya sp. SIO3F4]